jgi:hypothetical protein
MTSDNTKKMAATARPHKDENLDESYLEMASDETAGRRGIGMVRSLDRRYWQ